MKKMGIILAVFAAMAFAGGVAGETAKFVRYIDRIFEVDVQKDVSIVDEVPFYGESCPHYLATFAKFANVDVELYNFNENCKPDDYYDNKPLTMDLYTPKDDDEELRPVVLVLHGGAFVAGDKGDQSQKSVAYCDSLAARGYVTASLGYRKGVIAGGSTNGKTEENLIIDSTSFANTVYRGLQDPRTALRYLREHAKEMRIDPARIFLLGNSAGAILTLENIFSETEEDFPEYLDWISLGELDKYGEVSYTDESGTRLLNPHANAAVALWGAVHNVDMVKRNTASVPLLLIHGTGDDVVPFKTDYALKNLEAMFGSVSGNVKVLLQQLTYKIETPTLYGSYVIDSVLTAQNFLHETLFVEGAPHEVYNRTNWNGVNYRDVIQNKVFTFLYRSTIGDYSVEEPAFIIDPKPEGPDESIKNPDVEEPEKQESDTEKTEEDKKTDDKKADEKKDEKSNTIGKPIVLAHASSIVMGADNMNFTLSRGENVGYAVYDMSGKRLLVGRTSAGSVVDLSSLNNGIYMLLVKGERTVKFGLRK